MHLPSLCPGVMGMAAVYLDFEGHLALGYDPASCSVAASFCIYRLVASILCMLNHNNSVIEITACIAEASGGILV